MDHGLQAANQELATSIQNLHREMETMLEHLVINLNMNVEHMDLVKLLLEMHNFEIGGQLLERIVKTIQLIGSLLKIIKEGSKEVKKIRAPTSDINKLKETFLESYKIPIKMAEEMTTEIGEILEKLDKPASLLELGLDRVHGLGFIQEGASMEQLPVTLKVQVEHWPTTRNSKIKEKMGFLGQAVGRIEKIRSRV